MSEPFTLKIIAPSGVIYENEVVSVSVPGSEGRFQILRNHAPFLSGVKIGELDVVEKDGKKRRFAVTNGFSHVENNTMVLLTDSAEPGEIIDVERAKAALKRAEERIQAKDRSIDVERARLALARALNRLKVAGS
ncbi:MAG: F0F1 ATP synthase subunit epsilon [Chlorobi bacterium]|nr:F0F1 ATP synthase subunit epsilon [Chlorobiota bacterium]